MKLTIEPTRLVQRIEGASCRIWKGADENGTEVEVWVRMLSPLTHDAALLEAFERELTELPKIEPAVIDFRFVSD